MTDEVKQAIEHIRNLSPKLNQATNTASAVMAAAEKFLDECGVGIPVNELAHASAPIAAYIPEHEAGGEQRYQWEATYLSYRRCEGKYRFAVVTRMESGLPDGYDTFDREHRIESEEVVIWSSAPRDEKLATFVSLADLLESIAERAKKSLEAVEASSAKAVEIMKALGQSDRAANDASAKELASRLDVLSKMK